MGAGGHCARAHAHAVGSGGVARGAAWLAADGCGRVPAGCWAATRPGGAKPHAVPAARVRATAPARLPARLPAAPALGWLVRQGPSRSSASGADRLLRRLGGLSVPAAVRAPRLGPCAVARPAGARRWPLGARHSASAQRLSRACPGLPFVPSGAPASARLTISCSSPPPAPPTAVAMAQISSSHIDVPTPPAPATASTLWTLPRHPALSALAGPSPRRGSAPKRSSLPADWPFSLPLLLPQPCFAIPLAQLPSVQGVTPIHLRAARRTRSAHPRPSACHLPNPAPPPPLPLPSVPSAPRRRTAHRTAQPARPHAVCLPVIPCLRQLARAA